MGDPFEPLADPADDKTAKNPDGRCELGFNMRRIIHYGHFQDAPDEFGFIRFTIPEDIERALDGIEQCGARIIRAYVGHSALDADQTADRLAGFLDQISNRDVRVIAVLLDYYRDISEGDHWYAPAGAMPFYTEPIPNDPNLFALLSTA